MKTYYYISGNKQIGPVTIEQLASVGINRNTSVWCQGMPDWQPASNVEELQSILPPPISEYNRVSPPPPPENNNGKDKPEVDRYIQHTNLLPWAILTTLLCCLPAGIVSIIYANKANSAYSAGLEYEGDAANGNARIWMYVSIGIGVLGNFFLVILGIASA